MTDRLKRTVKIPKPTKVKTDDRGRTVWVDTVETAEFELMSTVMLKRIIDSDDESSKDKLRTAASAKEGILARDIKTDRFAVLDDDELRKVLENDATTAKRPADVTFEPAYSMDGSDDGLSDDEEELSLVSTQKLRRMLGQECDDSDKDEIEDELQVTSSQSFDPYNNS